MKIALRKVGKTPVEFDVASDDVTFKGFLQYHSGKLILLKANLKGLVDVACDLCAKEYKLPVDEEIEFFISDGVYHDEGNIELDVVESFDSTVDIEEILRSEIELIRGDYHTCEDCQDAELDLEIE